MNNIDVYSINAQYLHSSNAYIIDSTAQNLHTTSIQPISTVSETIGITNPDIKGRITLGNNSFSADTLGQLLSILITQYPELEI